MADLRKSTDGPSPLSPDGFDYTQLPDYDTDFVNDDDFARFQQALQAPEPSPSSDNLLVPQTPKRSTFITALNDWRPVHQRVRKKKKTRREPRRGVDETREGFVYSLLKWPLLCTVFGWLFVLGVMYLVTRVYIGLYEQWITWRGTRQRLRKKLNSTENYEDWVTAAKELDDHLGNEKWKQTDEYAYYDAKTIRRVKDTLSKLRAQVQHDTSSEKAEGSGGQAINQLRGLLEACVKSNFVGFENPHLYSESYYGTKHLVQGCVDEIEKSLELLSETNALSAEDKRTMFKHLSTNFGRTALCLSGGATFAYYHFGVAKALLDAGLLPNVITGTSGGALVAALLGTRTDDELKRMLIPALANKITACHDDMTTWFKRWYKTGARFDSVDWARRCAWFTRGSLTFREAYARTGRILNVSCVPSDPHSPTILANYHTSPDCVIWSAVLASAAVPGILNPVVLMKKNPDGTIEPYSFGHKWKDGSLRTDIPLKALNLHFNVRFSIVSQVNPHVNLFFFSSRGSVGRPVTHRRGRGWRGGYLGSAIEQYLKLDLTKWLKVLRHLELLPRPLGQDWSSIWLQRFSGTITIWPKSIPSDFYYILTDPTPQRLARMIHVGQQSAFPMLKFIANRMKIERLVEQGRHHARPTRPGLPSILSEEDLKGLLREAQRNGGSIAPPPVLSAPPSDSDSSSSQDSTPDRKKKNRPAPLLGASIDSALDDAKSPRDTGGKDDPAATASGAPSPSFSKRLSGWWSSLQHKAPDTPRAAALQRSAHLRGQGTRPGPYGGAGGHGQRPGSMFELRPPREFVEDEIYRHPPSPTTSRSGEKEKDQYGYLRDDGAAFARRGSGAREIFRQSRVFIDDSEDDEEEGVEEGPHQWVPGGMEEPDREREDDAVQRFLGTDDEGVGESGSSSEDADESSGGEGYASLRKRTGARRQSRGTFIG
ncbi:Patatin-like phospholipase domain-containing protein [Diplodia seriata]|uniref:Patatin-like phospholipase domain-containing protein n=1 Tax=Diplodia seriata TaxID=420778 RepID=A0A1S8B4R8_9PEZI|nr:Patatin-like phospholipase domain-containing protein [Diplodia seriata]